MKNYIFLIGVFLFSFSSFAQGYLDRTTLNRTKEEQGYELAFNVMEDVNFIGQMMNDKEMMDYINATIKTKNEIKLNQVIPDWMSYYSSDKLKNFWWIKRGEENVWFLTLKGLPNVACSPLTETKKILINMEERCKSVKAYYSQRQETYYTIDDKYYLLAVHNYRNSNNWEGPWISNNNFVDKLNSKEQCLKNNFVNLIWKRKK